MYNHQQRSTNDICIYFRTSDLIILYTLKHLKVTLHLILMKINVHDNEDVLS